MFLLFLVLLIPLALHAGRRTWTPDGRKGGGIVPKTSFDRSRHDYTKIVAKTSIIGFSLANAFRPKKVLASPRSPDLTIPMEWYDGSLCVRYYINGTVLRAIVDTGSPFLVVPTVCTGSWGCLSQSTISSIMASPQLEDTIEIFGGQEYDSKWREVPVSLSSEVTRNLLVCAVGSDVLLPPGGVFFGLVKYKSTNIRPTFLSQTNFQTIIYDAPGKKLTLSEHSVIDRISSSSSSSSSSSYQSLSNTMQLTDLRSLGDSVCHYAVKVKRVIVNGRLVCSTSEERRVLGWPDDLTVVDLDQQDVFAIFDTGTTGCMVQDEMFYDASFPQPPRSVEIVLEALSGESVTLKAQASRKNLFVVSPSKIPWFQAETRTNGGYTINNSTKALPPRIIVMGVAFLRDKVMTIDIDQQLLRLDS